MASKQRIVEAANDSARQLGYEKLKDLQLEVIIGIVSGRDVFAILPTGTGRASVTVACLESLTFWIIWLFHLSFVW